jgi:hypothetical protein
MRILGRYVFREILAGSLLAIIIATFVIFLQGVAPLLELLVRSKRAGVAFELIGLSLLPQLILRRWISADGCAAEIEAVARGAEPNTTRSARSSRSLI